MTWVSLLRLMTRKMDILLSIAVAGELETTPKEVPAMVSLMVADFISEEYCILHFSIGKRLNYIWGEGLNSLSMVVKMNQGKSLCLLNLRLSGRLHLIIERVIPWGINLAWSFERENVLWKHCDFQNFLPSPKRPFIESISCKIDSF